MGEDKAYGCINCCLALCILGILGLESYDLISRVYQDVQGPKATEARWERERIQREAEERSKTLKSKLFKFPCEKEGDLPQSDSLFQY